MGNSSLPVAVSVCFEYWTLRNEHVSEYGNYSVNVGHKLLFDNDFDVMNLKYVGNQRGVDYTTFIPSFLRSSLKDSLKLNYMPSVKQFQLQQD